MISVVIEAAAVFLMILSSTIDGFNGKISVLKNSELIFFEMKAFCQIDRKTVQKILLDMLIMSNELNINSLRSFV